MSIKNSQISQGSILLSSPWMNDDIFSRAVIYLTSHDMSSSTGLILNNPTHTFLHHLFKGVPHDIPVYNGGPVSKEHLYFLHDVPYLIPGSTYIKGKMYWGGDFEEIKRLLYYGLIDTSHIRFFLGYCGWDAFQIDREIKENSWICYDGEHHPLYDIEDNLYSKLLCGKNITEDIWIPSAIYDDNETIN